MTRVTHGSATDPGADPLTRALDRWADARSSTVLGAACVVLGGLVAAVTGPLELERGSWIAAYLVLVGGVAQIVLGAGQAWLAPTRPPRTIVGTQVLAWNAALVVVVAGTLAGLPVLTSLGGLVVMASLVMFLVVVRGSTAPPPWLRVVYVGTVVLVLASTPVGLALAWARRG